MNKITQSFIFRRTKVLFLLPSTHLIYTSKNVLTQSKFTINKYNEHAPSPTNEKECSAGTMATIIGCTEKIQKLDQLSNKDIAFGQSSLLGSVFKRLLEN